MQLRRCARMRRFRNWRSDTGCIRTRFMPGRSRFSTMRRACSRRGERFGGCGGGTRARKDGKALRQDRPTSGRTGFLGQEARAMSAPDRRAMVERPGKDLSVRRQSRACGRGALRGLPPQARRRGGRSGDDAPDRRTASRTSVLRLAANDLRTQQGRPWGQP